MIYAIEANIPLGPLNKVSVATNIHRDESVRAPAARPASKALGLYIRCWIIPSPIRAKGISPTLAIEFTRAEKVVALLHRRLHFCLSQQPRQITSLRSTATSSALMCSRSLGFSDETSRRCGWRWPTGAPPTNWVLGIIGGEDMAQLEEAADDLGVSTICAIDAVPPSRTDNTIITIKRDIIGTPEISAFIFGAAD
jgi:hypothetical protein